jgi:hypothetical protein
MKLFTSLKKCLKPLAFAAISVWALAVTAPVAAQVYASYAALDGSTGAPAYAFFNETNTGIYRPGASLWAVALKGVQAIFSDVKGSTIQGQLRAGQLVGAPTLSACGTSTIAGGDSAGVITFTAGAGSCTLTFKNPFAVAPTCYFNDRTTVAMTQGATYKVVESTTNVVVTFQGTTGASDVVSYMCIGNA